MMTSYEGPDSVKQILDAVNHLRQRAAELAANGDFARSEDILANAAALAAVARTLEANELRQELRRDANEDRQVLRLHWLSMFGGLVIPIVVFLLVFRLAGGADRYLLAAGLAAIPFALGTLINFSAIVVLRLLDFVFPKRVGNGFLRRSFYLSIICVGLCIAYMAPHVKCMGLEDLAERLQQEGKRADTIRVYENAINLDAPIPWKPGHYYAKYGAALDRSDRFFEAIVALQKAIEIDSSHEVEYKFWLARTLYNRGNQFHKNRKFPQAIEDYSKAIELDAKFLDAFGNRANAYDDIGEHDKAIGDYDVLVRGRPDDWRGYYNRSIAYRRKGEHAKAEADEREYKRLQGRAP